MNFTHIVQILLALLFYTVKELVHRLQRAALCTHYYKHVFEILL